MINHIENHALLTDKGNLYQNLKAYCKVKYLLLLLIQHLLFIKMEF